MSAPRELVVFCMEWIPSYRLAFYEQLAAKLDARNVDMRVIHGLPPGSRRQRRDHVEPDWATLVLNRVVNVKGLELTWQPVWASARDADLIVLQQEASKLFNYYALLRRQFGGPNIALWGHGENPDPSEVNSIGERLKAWTTPQADWFFAYTERSAEIVQSIGVGADRTTVVNNSRSLDNADFDSADAGPQIQQLCTDVASRSRHIGWMSSALDSSKRLPFLIKTLDGIRSCIPDFEFFILGRGPDERIVFEAAASRPWLHAVGAQFGPDKVAVGEICQVMIHPGLLGLHVIDAFAFETPIVTTEFVSHSHEFAYLEDGGNAVVLDESASAEDLAAASVRALTNARNRERLAQGCRTSAEVFSLSKMTDRFADGICSAIDV